MIAWEKEKRDRLHRIIEKYSQPPEPRHQLPIYQSRNTAGTTSEYSCAAILDDFSQNSTIHGIKYMGDRKRHWAERLWWLTAFVLSIYGCTSLIMHIWQRWERSPVIVSFAEKSTPIWQIPFPAVTICSETKTQSDLFNYTEMYSLIQKIDSNTMRNNLTQEQ